MAYLYTESADFLRELIGETCPDRTTAARMKAQCAEILGVDERVMAEIFVDASRYRKIRKSVDIISACFYKDLNYESR